MEELLNLEFFLVKNAEGKLFRRKGYGGYGDNWVDDVKKARVYNKIGPARACVSFYANHWPEYSLPKIIKLTISEYAVIDETERIEKIKQRKEKAEANKELLTKEESLRKAQKDFEIAQKNLERLNN